MACRLPIAVRNLRKGLERLVCVCHLARLGQSPLERRGAVLEHGLAVRNDDELDR